MVAIIDTIDKLKSDEIIGVGKSPSSFCMFYYLSFPCRPSIVGNRGYAGETFTDSLCPDKNKVRVMTLVYYKLMAVKNKVEAICAHFELSIRNLQSFAKDPSAFKGVNLFPVKVVADIEKKRKRHDNDEKKQILRTTALRKLNHPLYREDPVE